MTPTLHPKATAHAHAAMPVLRARRHSPVVRLRGAAESAVGRLSWSRRQAADLLPARPGDGRGAVGAAGDLALLGRHGLGRGGLALPRDGGAAHAGFGPLGARWVELVLREQDSVRVISAANAAINAGVRNCLAGCSHSDLRKLPSLAGSAWSPGSRRTARVGHAA